MNLTDGVKKGTSMSARLAMMRLLTRLPNTLSAQIVVDSVGMLTRTACALVPLPTWQKLVERYGNKQVAVLRFVSLLSANLCGSPD